MKIFSVNSISFGNVLSPSGLTFSPQQKAIIKEIKQKMDKNSEKQPGKTYNQILKESGQDLLVLNGDTKNSVRISVVSVDKKNNSQANINYTSGDSYVKNQFNPQKLLDQYNEAQRNINVLTLSLLAFVASMVGIASIQANKSNDNTVIQSEQGDTFEKTINDSTLVLHPDDFENNKEVEK